MMRSISRRQFLARSGMGLAAAGCLSAGAQRLHASPLGLPIGLQLYTVRDALEEDFDGTLWQVAELGYREVELYGLLGRKPSDLRKALEAAGLRCHSAHFGVTAPRADVEGMIADAKELGVTYMVCAFPGVADPARLKPASSRPIDYVRAIWEGLTLDDWRWNADLFNKVGEQTKKAGIQFGYHNHSMEFKRFGDVLAYDELLRRADPDLVKMELDCGWVAVAGLDPTAYLTKHPGRFPLLHVKDVKAGFQPSTELGAAPFTEVGRGTIDWKEVFAAAKRGGVEYYYVEQDTTDRPPLEAVRISYTYLHDLDEP